jgi:DNA-binding IclR family transcriptional regulator
VAEREPGVASVSAPVRDGAGRAVAAIGVSGPIERLGRRPGPRFAEAVVGAARDLERRAGLAR